MIADLTFAYPSRVHLLWGALAVVAVLAWLELRGRDWLQRFMSATMQLRLAERATLRRRLVRLGLILAALVLGVLGLMRPQSPGLTQTVAGQKLSADIMVVLDVSKSMLAEDAAPTRLSRARAEVTELVDWVQGHRVGLVAFAGRASVLCPLTPDYGFFRMVLRTVDTKSVALGGTRIGEAIRKAVAAFGSGAGARLILLITDGEDQDSYPLDAAKEALAAGIRIVAIGFGSEEGSEISLVDPETGARTMLADRNGNVVRTRLDGELLRQIALVTEGVYVPAGVAALDLESIVEAHVKPIVRQGQQVAARVEPAEHFQWLVLGSLLALVGAVWVGSGVGRRRMA